MSRPILTAKQVSKSFAGSVVALKEVSFEIPFGQVCVLLGKSGAGKSTLLRMFTGLELPNEGQVFVDQEQVTPKSLKRVRSKIGTIHQKFQLVSRLPILENVLAGAMPKVALWRVIFRWFPWALKRKACQLLADVGLEEQHLYRRADAISGGQQQRVAIARAFIMNPKVIIADEPVASLDPHTGESILELIRKFTESTRGTVLCSLHQVEMAKKFADRIIGLNKGRVVFDGKPSHLSELDIKRIYSD